MVISTYGCLTTTCIYTTVWLYLLYVIQWYIESCKMNMKKRVLREKKIVKSTPQESCQDPGLPVDLTWWRRPCGFVKWLCNWHKMFELLTTTIICLFFRSNITNILSLIALFILAPFSKSTNRIAAHARNTTLFPVFSPRKFKMM